MRKKAILSAISILFTIHFCLIFSDFYYPQSTNLRRTKFSTEPINIEHLLRQGLSDKDISNDLARHLWQSWDDIIANFSFVASNIEHLRANHPAVLRAFLISLFSDMRAQIVPSLTSDADSTCHNLKTIEELWQIDDKISSYMLSLDSESGGDSYFLRYLLVSISRMLPGRVDVERFKMLYDETLARGRAEITYSDLRDWSASRHGVTETSKIVSCADLEQELDTLKKNNFAVFDGDIKIIDSPDPSKSRPELAGLSSKEVYQELTAMLNVLQRPFRIQNVQSINVAYQWWRSETDASLDSDYDELLESRFFTLQYGDPIRNIETLIAIRENLHRIMSDDSLEDNTRTATLIFDKHISAFMKQIFMDYVKYLPDLSHNIDSARLERQVKEQDNIIRMLNSMVRSLIMDRYVPHRIWLMPVGLAAEVKPLQFDLNRDYGQVEISEAERFKQEFVILEMIIDEITKSMHGEEFEVGAAAVPFADIIQAKIDAYPQLYQQIVSERQSTFPNLDFLVAHLMDSNIALSALRQIEAVKDFLKIIARARFPEL
ncbi:MAG: hypothetical protein PHQ54_04955, partial [Candidatus Omnitrophica bacterium]|nr:hypothetical protein [Candidatus Omnitrophota bacterium]